MYTTLSRAVYTYPFLDTSEPVEISVVKLPEVEHKNSFIEPMTLWRWNKEGANKNSFTPRKHSAEQALWRSFGIIAMTNSYNGDVKQRRPGIFGQCRKLKEIVGSRKIDLVGVSMQDDGNATSWLPIDEIVDSFRINDLVISDTDNDGCIIRINNAVETTKSVVEVDFKSFLRGVCTIRGLKTAEPMDTVAAGFIARETAEMYMIIDPAFKEWIASIEPEDSKEEKISEWYMKLKMVALKQGEKLFNNSTEKDIKGIVTETGIENIATKYIQYVSRINKKLGSGGVS